MLARHLDIAFIDSDHEVEVETDLTISEIFGRYGEQRFRDLERNVINRSIGCTPCVVATGPQVWFHRIGASWRAGVMDTVVTSAGAGSWSLEDRLARTLGTITLSNEGQFLIRPVHGKLSGIKTGPFASLDLAMAEIENQTKGACQLTTGM